MGDWFQWIINWRDHWHWFMVITTPAAWRGVRRLRGKPPPKRSFFARLILIANRLGELGMANVTVVTLKLEAAVNDTKAAKTIAEKDRQIAALQNQLATRVCSPESQAPSPTSASPKISE